jgi:uncharacterized protein (DUF305 family)
VRDSRSMEARHLTEKIINDQRAEIGQMATPSAQQ